MKFDSPRIEIYKLNISIRIKKKMIKFFKSAITLVNMVTIGEKLEKILRKKKVFPMPRKDTTIMRIFGALSNGL